MSELPTRGHDHNIKMKKSVAEALGLEPRAAEDLVLVRLTPPEYDQLLALGLGSRVGIINLQHYEPDPKLPEFTINSFQYGVRIRIPGRNTATEKVEPVLEEEKPVIELRLDALHMGVESQSALSDHAFGVDHLLLGASDNINDFLMQKYGSTMEAEALRNPLCYLRVFTITRAFELPVLQ